MADWWYPPKPKPRRVAKDGIKARSRRGEIGESWWSQRFVAVLEALCDRNRLRRGRSYARAGQVMGLTVQPGAVTARVQGSRRTPYAVRIGVRPLSAAEWARVETTMAERAVFLAALLAGEMPRNIEEAFASAELSLFPASARELTSECSCPDWANPCKHVAATYYILAEAFDDDPFLIFAWRGRPRNELLERLREVRGTHSDGAGTRAQAEAEPDSEPDAEAEPLDRQLAGFWAAGPELAGMRFAPRAVEVPDAVLRELGSPPVPESVLRRLAAAYSVMADAAGRRALDG
jgi:uncharacterized Zn finger protein